jgi:hypothetical protein
MSIAQSIAGEPSAPAVSPAPSRISDVAPAGSTAATAATAPIAARDANQLHLGYQRVKPQLDALRVNELLQINLDVPAAVQVGLGAAAEIAAFEVPFRALAAVGFQVEDVLQLRDRALALGHAHLEYATATGAPDPSLIQALFKGRSRLVAHAAPLVEDGYFTEAAVAAHRSGYSHRDVAYNVIGLAGLYLKHWDRVQPLVSLKQTELEQLRAQANDLLLLLSTREQNPDEDAAWLLERQKAFTLFIRAFTEARHGVAFLRRLEGDLNEIIPTLYARKRRTRRDANEEETPDDALVESAEGNSATGNGTAGGSGTSTLSAAGSSSASAPAEPPPPAIPVGLPGSPPLFSDEP